MLLIALKHVVLWTEIFNLARIAHAINSVETHEFIKFFFSVKRVLRMLLIALKRSAMYRMLQR